MENDQSLKNDMIAADKEIVNNSLNNKHVLRKIQELCDDLIQYRVNYCHWKSNNAIDRSASGENDLDLLVNRNDISKFLGILLRLDFKQAEGCNKYQIPGILDYYSVDQDTGILIHVHVHYQLVLGHDATKNYHIPIEEPYLASSIFNGLFRVPSLEFELVIYVIRLMLKHSTWDTIILGQGRLSQLERDELDYLVQGASQSGVVDILRKHLPYINPRLFTDCVNLLTSNSKLWERGQAGQKLLNCLKPFCRKPQIIDSGLKFWRRFAWPFESRIIRRDARKQMNSGGVMIAIVGGDGAGKTTIVEDIYKWLSDTFKVYTYHMGKPQWSYLTILIRGTLKIGRSLGLYPFMRSEPQYTDDTASLIFPGYPSLIRDLCTARDRLLTYSRARRLATNGALVILDRFPLPQIKYMDGPHLSRITANMPKTKLMDFLIHLEEKYYWGIALPDMLIVLRADPEIAVRRKTDEDELSVRARSTEIWNLDWKQVPCTVIDANQSKEEVLSEVRRKIWSRL